METDGINDWGKMKKNLPLDKNPAWLNMADYGCFNDALAAMRYYDERYVRWQRLREQIQRSMALLFKMH